MLYSHAFIKVALSETEIQSDSYTVSHFVVLATYNEAACLFLCFDCYSANVRGVCSINFTYAI